MRNKLSKEELCYIKNPKERSDISIFYFFIAENYSKFFLRFYRK